jgi:hypothetical protein
MRRFENLKMRRFDELKKKKLKEVNKNEGCFLHLNSS